MQALPLWGVLILAMVAASLAAFHEDTSQPTGLEAEVIRRQSKSDNVDHAVVNICFKHAASGIRDSATCRRLI